MPGTKTLTVRALIPGQGAAWTFDLYEAEDGGVVVVPARSEGAPIDWPPEHPEQAAWLEAFTSKLEPRAAHAWWLPRGEWTRLVERLEAQVADEGAS